MSGLITEVDFLLATGWTWEEYLNTPDLVVMAMREVLRARSEAMDQQQGTGDAFERDVADWKREHADDPRTLGLPMESIDA